MHMLPWLAGYIPDLPSPFDHDGALDEVAFRRICQRQIDAGAKALVVGETTGEFSTLSPQEHMRLVRLAVEVADGRAAVIAGAGSNATMQAMELARSAWKSGAQAILSVTPYYNKPTQAGIVAHFEAIAAAVPLPIILHDVPARSLRSLTDETVVQLASSTQFVGLADASGDIGRIARLRVLLPSRFRLLSADEATAVSFLLQGGDGCISATANIAPLTCRSLHASCRRRNLRSALALAARLEPLCEAVHQDSAPAAVKHALAMFRLMSPQVRLPLTELSGAAKTALELTMMGFGASEQPAGAGSGSVSLTAPAPHRTFLGVRRAAR